MASTALQSAMALTAWLDKTMCAAGQKLAVEPLAKDTVASSLCIDDTFCMPVQLKVTGKRCTGLMTYTEQVIDANSGTTLYTFNYKQGLACLTITVHDGSGKLICVAKGKRGLMTASFKVLRPEQAYYGQPSADTFKNEKAKRAKKHGVALSDVLLESKHDGGAQPQGDLALYELGEGKMKMGLGTGTCTYSVLAQDKALVPLYEAKKVRAVSFVCRVESCKDGQLVGKCAQLGIDPSKVAMEVGAGVDVVAFALLSAFVGAAVNGAGGASPVGALAGAGAV